MKHSSAPIFIQSGFSLIEMAVVLFIIALLLGGLLPTVSSQIEQQKRAETKKQLDEIQQALIGFAFANGRLPCPALETTPNDQATAGQEKLKTGTIGPTLECANAQGVLPWATLGVSETDSWGRRFTYRVTLHFADAIELPNYAGCVPSPIPIFSSFALCSKGDIFVRTKSSGGTIIASIIPAVVVSHGANGLGGFLPSGLQVLPLPAANVDEKENTDNNVNFVSHENSAIFDDMLIFISPNILYNRMVSAGKLP